MYEGKLKRKKKKKKKKKPTGKIPLRRPTIDGMTILKLILKNRSAFKILTVKITGKKPLGRRIIVGITILKCILKK